MPGYPTAAKSHSGKLLDNASQGGETKVSTLVAFVLPNNLAHLGGVQAEVVSDVLHRICATAVGSRNRAISVSMRSSNVLNRLRGGPWSGLGDSRRPVRLAMFSRRIGLAIAAKVAYRRKDERTDLVCVLSSSAQVLPTSPRRVRPIREEKPDPRSILSFICSPHFPYPQRCLSISENHGSGL